MEEIIKGIFRWSWFSQEKGYDFNGYLLMSGQDRVLIDPAPMTPQDQAWLRAQGAVGHILLTNRDHVREAQGFRNQLSSRILIHEEDAPLVEIEVDGTFHDGDRLPGGLLALHVPNNKSPGETAFFLDRDGGILIVGDALIGNPAGQLNLMPPEKYLNPMEARDGIRALLKYQYELLLPGDGVPILSGGRGAVEQFLERG